MKKIILASLLATSLATVAFAGATVEAPGTANAVGNPGTANVSAPVVAVHAHKQEQKADKKKTVAAAKVIQNKDNQEPAPAAPTSTGP
jgi:hypothetical protein